MGDWLEATTLSGSLVLAVPVAVLAGLVSFFSPCVLPLLPGYLSYATGLSGADIATGDVRRGRMVAGSVLFVLGFTVVFVILGAAVGGMRTWLLVNKQALDIGLGIFSIVLGLAFMGLFARGSSATCACTRCPPSDWPPPPSSASCSAWAGPPASARRSE